MMRRLIPFAVLAAALIACDDHDHDDHDHGGESLAAEACEHAAEGPFQGVDASADPANAPAIQSYEHTRVDVALVDDGGQNGGSVLFTAGAEGDYIFFLTSDVSLAFEGPDGAIAVESTADVTECDDVVVAYTVELPAGDITLTFGPTAESTVGVIFEAAGEDHDH